MATETMAQQEESSVMGSEWDARDSKPPLSTKQPTNRLNEPNNLNPNKALTYQNIINPRKIIHASNSQKRKSYLSCFAAKA